MSQAPVTFVHQFRPAVADNVAATTLLLLYNTGGDENDLLPIGRRFDSGVNLLSPAVKHKLLSQILDACIERFSLKQYSS